MLEKLIVGRYIELDIKTLNSKPPEAAAKPPFGSFIDSTVMQLNLQQSVSERAGIFTSNRTSGISPGVNNAKVHRNFQWLKWVPPYISQTPLRGVDILTGPMSGCWVIAYRWPGAEGEVHVGHLGTCGDTTWDNGMKAGWTQFAGNNPGALISGFQPNRAFPDAELSVGVNLDKDEKTVIYGLVTPNLRYYAVKLARIGNFGSKYRIVSVRECTATEGTALQTIFD